MKIRVINGYSITPTGTIILFLGGEQRRRIPRSDRNYKYWLLQVIDGGGSAGEHANSIYESILSDERAARQASENLSTNTQQPAEPEATEPAETPERDPKATHGPVPEKTWIGSTMTGNGWKIFFNPKAQRTQISFTSANIPEAVKAILEAEHFFYCNSSRTWNKGLKWKAYRAAQRIAEELNKAFPAA